MHWQIRASSDNLFPLLYLIVAPSANWVTSIDACQRLSHYVQWDMSTQFIYTPLATNVLHSCRYNTSQRLVEHMCWWECVLSSDPSFTPPNLIPVFQAITGDWGWIIPRARAKLIREKFSVRKQRTEAGKYYALYHHNSTWQRLSLRLYSAGETVAVDIARPHVQTVTGHVYLYNTYNMYTWHNMQLLRCAVHIILTWSTCKYYLHHIIEELDLTEKSPIKLGVEPKTFWLLVRLSYNWLWELLMEIFCTMSSSISYVRIVHWLGSMHHPSPSPHDILHVLYVHVLKISWQLIYSMMENLVTVCTISVMLVIVWCWLFCPVLTLHVYYTSVRIISWNEEG